MHTASEIAQELVEALAQQGWWIGKHYLDLALIEPLSTEANQLYQAQTMTAAGIGRGQQFQRNAQIRQDFIHWLNGETEIQRNYFSQMEALRQLLNRTLFLGLFEFEAHYAIYPPGAYYKKHLDSFQGAANRIISTVTYLNTNWPDHGGGQLHIYAPESDQIIQTVVPEAGTMAIFLSEEIAHEVQTSHFQRASIAGWFRLKS